MIVHPDTNLSQAHAGPVLARMRALLAKRHVCAITRRVFLFRWSRLRRELATTVEYQRFVKIVRARDGYQCVSCGRPAVTVHHIRSVARALPLVLDPRNGQVVCSDCHAEVHPHMRKAS